MIGILKCGSFKRPLAPSKSMLSGHRWFTKHHFVCNEEQLDTLTFHYESLNHLKSLETLLMLLLHWKQF